MQFGDKIGEKIIYVNGSFRRKLIWFSGWNQQLAEEYGKKEAVVRFINGFSGKEMEVIVEEIRPVVIFEVL